MAAPERNAPHDDFPVEIRDRLESFDTQLVQVENEIKNFISTPLSEIQEKLSLVERAKVDLITAYSVNSLFWTFLIARGENPREHPVKQELARIQTHMKRAKEIEQELKDKEKAMKIDKTAAKRFVVGALGNQIKEDEAARNTEDHGTVSKAKKNLWKKAHHRTDTPAASKQSSASVNQTFSANKGRKRQSFGSSPDAKKKRKR